MSASDASGAVVITGAGGFVGQNLARCFAAWGPVVGLDMKESAGVVSVDLRDAEATRAAVLHAKPAAVIHVAGIKDVRLCEREPQVAHEANVTTTANIARACREAGARMIYLSTDLVFESSRGGYREDEEPTPTTEYGRSKLAGERVAKEILPHVAICRSAGIYGQKSPLLRWLGDELRAGKRVQCFTDVYNTPTYADNLAEMMRAILDRSLSGIFHTVGRERVNRFEFFRCFARVFELREDLLDPVAGGEQRDAMLLQADSSLSSEKTAATLGVELNSVAEGLLRLRESGTPL